MVVHKKQNEEHKRRNWCFNLKRKKFFYVKIFESKYFNDWLWKERRDMNGQNGNKMGTTTLICRSGLVLHSHVFIGSAVSRQHRASPSSATKRESQWKINSDERKRKTVSSKRNFKCVKDSAERREPLSRRSAFLSYAQWLYTEWANSKDTYLPMAPIHSSFSFSVLAYM